MGKSKLGAKYQNLISIYIYMRNNGKKKPINVIESLIDNSQRECSSRLNLRGAYLSAWVVTFSTSSLFIIIQLSEQQPWIFSGYF